MNNTTHAAVGGGVRVICSFESESWQTSRSLGTRLEQVRQHLHSNGRKLGFLYLGILCLGIMVPVFTAGVSGLCEVDGNSILWGFKELITLTKDPSSAAGGKGSNNVEAGLENGSQLAHSGFSGFRQGATGGNASGTTGMRLAGELEDE